MKTPHPLYNDRLTVYTCELTTCALCGARLVERGYQSSPKTIFTMAGVYRAAQRPKRCPAAQVPAEVLRTPVQHGEQARFLGGAIEPATARPGDTVWVTIYWEALQPFDRDYTVFVHLTDRAGRSVAEANNWPGLGAYPTRLWQSGTVVVDRYPLKLPGDVPAPALLTVDTGFFIWKTAEQLPSWAEDGAPAASVIGALRVLPTAPTPVQPQNRLDVRFGDSIRLAGFDLRPAGKLAPGGRLSLDLVWAAARRIPADYTVFVHLRRSDGSNLTGADGPPIGGGWPTSAWEPGAPVLDARELSIPADAQPGTYSLWVGLYRPPEGVRLPVVGSGLRVQDDALFLGEVVVGND